MYTDYIYTYTYIYIYIYIVIAVLIVSLHPSPSDSVEKVSYIVLINTILNIYIYIITTKYEHL